LKRAHETEKEYDTLVGQESMVAYSRRTAASSAAHGSLGKKELAGFQAHYRLEKVDATQ